MRRLIIALLLAASPLAAQTVRGTVVRPDGSPAAYVVVTATDDKAQQARALTDARGAYRLQLPAPAARYRLRALQVGWQPTDGALVGPFASDTASVDAPPIMMLGLPIALPAVTVRSADVCGEKARDGAAVAAVWEQARTALLASRLRADTSRLDATLRTEWMEYDRQLDADQKHVVQQTRRLGRGQTAHAFSSIAADSLAAHGYVVDGADGTTFHAPDADVLLSPSFASAHCFGLEPAPADQPSWIGVSFRPARAVTGRADVRGTLWLEQATSELRELRFRYTNLPAAADAADPGGEVRFLHLGTGEWLVQQWIIRMPLVAARAGNVSIGRRNLVVNPTSRSLTGVQIAGGDVLRVVRGDTPLFEGEGATLEVRTTSPEPALQHGALRASLEGTDYTWSSDATGVARLRPVLPGTYQLRVQHALLDSLGVRLPVVPISITEDGRVVEMALPSLRDIRQAVCGDSLAGRALLRGVVRDARGARVANATVRVRVLRDTAAARNEARVILNDDAIRVPSDSSGTWQLCGVPTNTPLAVYGAGLAGTHDTLFTAASELAALDLTLARRDIAALSMRVIDDHQQPLRDVVVEVTPLAGEPFTMRTDAGGRTSARNLPRGTATVRLRRVGYQEGTITVELAPGTNEVPVLLDPTASPTLDTVKVSAARVTNTRHSDFDRRRATSRASLIIDREEIERRGPVSTWQLLTRVPGMIVLDSLGYRYAKSTRERALSCWMRVAIDGRLLPEGRPNLAMLLPPTEVYGIEVFSGPATIPPEFTSQAAMETGERSRTWCGIISIWTR
ncbi:MAG: carboxypeptidase regulatory-like domain-containing protein [Gemmatimonadaceae bacterium]|nr:carboxypeptidase regulatory-like domain-containing protein [Gemmatimonadaceae bacterium]